MIPVTTPEALERECMRLARENYIGCLLSGGSDAQGRLPWKLFTKTIRKIKDTTDLKISIHTGVIEPDVSMALKESGVDQVLIDVIGADETMKQVYNLDATTESIRKSLESLYKTGHHVIPHIVIGIHFGLILGEYNALNMLQPFKPANLVLVLLNPIHGTPMEQVQPVSVFDFEDILRKAQRMLPDADISLGCARPRDATCFSYEKAAIDNGVNKIAFPSERAIEYVKKQNLEVIHEQTCCSW
jgi:uncharacterized radical SAM superfamily protein